MEELIRLNNRTATTTERSDAGGQGGLFGEQEMIRSLLPEKAEVSDCVRKELGAEKKLFGASPAKPRPSVPTRAAYCTIS